MGHQQQLLWQHNTTTSCSSNSSSNGWVTQCSECKMLAGGAVTPSAALPFIDKRAHTSHIHTCNLTGGTAPTLLAVEET
jgi:hypothetical protein